MNARRGHETQRHIEAKQTIGRLFKSEDWSVFFEQRNADILVLHHASRKVFSIEAESTPRNVLRNIERNTAYGCHAVAVVSLTERFYGQIKGKVFKHSDLHPDLPIQLFRYDEQSLSELHVWISSLVNNPTEIKGS